MDNPLAGKKVAILVANGFEELDMTEPQRALLGAGATVKIVSHEQGLVNGWYGAAWGHFFPIDTPAGQALAADFDALLIPGGERGVERLASNPHAKRLVRGFVDGRKAIVAIGHGVLMLESAERLSGRTVVAEGALAERLQAAGATLAEGDITVDSNLLTATDAADKAAVKEAAVKLVADIGAGLADAA